MGESAGSGLSSRLPLAQAFLGSPSSSSGLRREGTAQSSGPPGPRRCGGREVCRRGGLCPDPRREGRRVQSSGLLTCRPKHGRYVSGHFFSVARGVTFTMSARDEGLHRVSACGPLCVQWPSGCLSGAPEGLGMGRHLAAASAAALLLSRCPGPAASSRPLAGEGSRLSTALPTSQGSCHQPLFHCTASLPNAVILGAPVFCEELFSSS